MIYKNTDAILKWQDDHWLAKATWKQIDRHYPEPISNNYGAPAYLDLVDDPIYHHRFQKITATEVLLGRRDTVGNLEWGWQVDYLNQTKKYDIDNWEALAASDTVLTRQPGFWWSEYDSKRFGVKVDGTYKMGKNHLLEFLVDTSKEKMDITGWHYDQKESGSSMTTNSRYRTNYEQTIFNAQLQDTITLNKKGDFWLTPSIRYNRSTIYGASKYYDKTTYPQNWTFFNESDEQNDGKATWQMALKKQVNDKLTLRATYGTYYRLLNMYEIAGDGAGIVPMPNVGTAGATCVFPQPEEGKQWDIGAIWESKALGADTAKFQLTYFGRDSQKMLQLTSWNNFFFVYNNAASALINGVEAQADLSWKKWDVNFSATYTKATNIEFDMSAVPQYGQWANLHGGYLTYQPEWEGTMRFTYRPDKKWNLFTQMRYVGSMYTQQFENGGLLLAPCQSSLTTIDLGMKYKFNKNFQLAVGVNDVFNKANDMYDGDYWGNSNTVAYPLQGRTYYTTLQYNF